MGGRYLITGVQLGMIEAYIENLNGQDLSIIESITDNQFVGNSSKDIVEDVEIVSVCFGDGDEGGN